MRFELKRTTATFGVFHPREEKNKGMACDIPFKITIGAQFLDMLAPAQRAEGEEANPEAFMNELWTAEGYVRRPSLNPLKLYRKPEGATVTIWDEAADKKNGKPLELKPCNLNLKDAELMSPHQFVLSGQIQYSQYNDKELARINALTGKNLDIEILIEQVDMFDADKDEKKEAAAGGEDPDATNREPGSDDESGSEPETEREQEDPEE
jgi:hypothetical protein